MARLAGLSFIAAAEATLYATHYGAHCYAGHGGTPVDAQDTPLSNVKLSDCETACDNNPKCTAVTLEEAATHSHHDPNGDCYLRANVNITECDKSEDSYSKWITSIQVAPPPLKGNVLYHLFEPKYTGLANKDAGDFKGDAAFIFETFNSWEKTNPEASMAHNIIEMSEVNATGWGKYEYCNAPGATGMFTCAENATDYCCTVRDASGHQVVTNHTRTQLPGIEVPGHALSDGSIGFWFSFPRESQGVTWTEKLLRRIKGQCLGDAWRKDAGGCSSCNETLDSCVADCIQKNMPLKDIQATWDRVFANPKECPEVPLPAAAPVVV